MVKKRYIYEKLYMLLLFLHHKLQVQKIVNESRCESKAKTHGRMRIQSPLGSCDVNHLNMATYAYSFIRGPQLVIFFFLFSTPIHLERLGSIILMTMPRNHFKKKTPFFLSIRKKKPAASRAQNTFGLSEIVRHVLALLCSNANFYLNWY